MQTFLPYPDFKRSAESLDYKRLGKQRIEALQIYNIITGNTESGAWKNHPAVKMWENYDFYLARYYNAIITEWASRGFENNMRPILTYLVPTFPFNAPWWLGNKKFHRAMRSRLIQKYPEHYLSQWPEDQGFNNCKYLWPVNENRTFRIIQ